MEKKWIHAPSACGTEIRCRLVRQEGGGSRSLAVLFPGRGYSCDMPVLYYAGKSAMEAGYDLLNLEYGYQAARREPKSFEEMTAAASADCAEVLRPLLERYDRLAFIGKSIGTVVSGLTLEALKEEGKEKEIRHLFLTPLAQTIPFMLQYGGLAVAGTNDPAFGPEELRRIEAAEGIELLQPEGADHALETGEAGQSLDMLRMVLAGMESWLRRGAAGSGERA
ncbi:alpha/beta hydrolase [Paenibacillus pasadenensis]|uniref:Alpha/beta hydrolase n=1 Tax=Paenibacillus pasadenensis TaxID=217090 RepID=A0A2N5NBJ6_9BACL|nr:alpha/beta hydrolase [Paenibacillus pasadenensis]PLT47721.1 hypothetical protein B8V81_1945 [Paenibacillus pasadenensis]